MAQNIETLGRGGGELASVYRTGGIDRDHAAAPERARWFTPQLVVAAGTIKVAGSAASAAARVLLPGPRPAGYEHEPAISWLAPAAGHRHGLLAILPGSAGTNRAVVRLWFGVCCWLLRSVAPVRAGSGDDV